MLGEGKRNTKCWEFEGLVSTAVEHIVNENIIFAAKFHIEIVFLIVFAGDKRGIVNV